MSIYLYLLAGLVLSGLVDGNSDTNSDEIVNNTHIEQFSGLSAEEEAELNGALVTDSQSAEVPITASKVNGRAMPGVSLDIALTGDIALAWFSGENMQAGAHDPHKLGFNLQQVEMTLGAAVDHLFRMDANLVFSLSGVELEEAYVTTLGLPGNLQLRAGQFLSRIGRINATHPHAWDFVDQPLALGKFYGAEGNRGLGVEISWLSCLPWYLELVASAQMATSAASNRSFLNTEEEITGARDLLYTVAIKQFFPFSSTVGFYWGLSAQFGPNNTGYHNRSNIYATDLHLKYSPVRFPDMSLVFQSEIFVRQRQIPHDCLTDVAGYAQLVWQINKNWGTGLRGEYGSGVENDYLDPEWSADRWRAAYQVTWSPSHFTRLRGQASMDWPRWLDKPVYALVLAFEFTAGSHPAHNY